MPARQYLEAGMVIALNYRTAARSSGKENCRVGAGGESTLNFRPGSGTGYYPRGRVCCIDRLACRKNWS
jgi:hypothetical protein